MKENPIKIAFELKKFEVVDYLLDQLKEIPNYHFELLERTFTNDKDRLSKLNRIPILASP